MASCLSWLLPALSPACFLLSLYLGLCEDLDAVGPEEFLGPQGQLLRLRVQGLQGMAGSRWRQLATAPLVTAGDVGPWLTWGWGVGCYRTELHRLHLLEAPWLGPGVSTEDSRHGGHERGSKWACVGPSGTASPCLVHVPPNTHLAQLGPVVGEVPVQRAQDDPV